MPSSLSIAYRDFYYKSDAETLSQDLNLPHFQLNTPLKKHSEFDYLLLLTDEGLSIAKTGKSAPNPVSVDFVSGAVAHRRVFGGGKGQDIAKAIGLNKRSNLSVLDGTAGLGRDAFVFASLGCDVVMLERVPFVRALLKNGLLRASLSEDISGIIHRMTFLDGDISGQTENKYDVVYLDPMYPHIEKSAAVKKEMAFFRELIGFDDDADYLLEHAKKIASYRVVVKRPKGAPYLNNEPPTYQVEGKSGRFDVYVNKTLD